MVRRFLSDGFDVYISADHGNTACVGLGRIMGSGVEVETKSHKMLVLKDFADKESLIQKYGLVEYPKYYLPKEYDYLICNVGESLDIKGEAVMTHGGMSLDEVVVPFIKIIKFSCKTRMDEKGCSLAGRESSGGRIQKTAGGTSVL